MTNSFGMGRERRAVDPSLGYWLGPSVTPEDYSHAPSYRQMPIIPHSAPAVDSNLATSLSEHPRISDRGRVVEHPLAYNIQTNNGGDLLLGNSPQQSILDSARMIDEERTRTLDRASPLLFPCSEKAPGISFLPPAEPSAPFQRNIITVEQFLRAHSQTRKPAKRSNYKQRQKATIKSDLERLKAADSSFAREEDQLSPDDDADPPALQTKRRRKNQTAGNHQTARKRRRTRKTEETDAVQPLELQEGPLPNIATRSLHERWHPVDSRKGRPFIQPTFADGRYRVSLGPLNPAPVPPLKQTDDGLYDNSPHAQHAPLTAIVPGKQARRSTRTMLSMEPTEEHERKLKSWKSNHGQGLSSKPLRLILNDGQHGGTARASHLVHSPNISSGTSLTVPRRNILGHADISDSTLSTSECALGPTEELKPTANAETTSKLPAVPLSTAIIDQDQGDQSVVLVEDSFLDIDEPARVSQPPTAYPSPTLTHLSNILGRLLKTVK